MKTSTPALVNESKERASPKKRLETEYLILGSGATGMAFVNKILIQGTTDRITLLDKHAQPGGHRNDTNAYASLHQRAGIFKAHSPPPSSMSNRGQKGGSRERERERELGSAGERSLFNPYIRLPEHGAGLIASEGISRYKLGMQKIKFALAMISVSVFLACSGSDSTGSSISSEAANAKWSALYWTNSNQETSFAWTLPTDGSIGRLIAMPANSNDDCSAWGGMDTPGTTAQGALNAWTAAGGSSDAFEVWMRVRDGQAPTAAAITTFDGCVKHDCSSCPKATGVLCILDSGSSNDCLSSPPAGYTYGVMRGPQMMGTVSSYSYEAARSLAQVHFGEVYDLSTPTSPCPSTGTDFGRFVDSYIDAHSNSRGATNAGPTFGGDGATCPLATDQLPNALDAMSTQYFDRIGLWSS